MKLNVFSMTKGIFVETIFQRRVMQKIKLLMWNILIVKLSLMGVDGNLKARMGFDREPGPNLK